MASPFSKLMVTALNTAKWHECMDARVKYTIPAGYIQFQRMHRCRRSKQARALLIAQQARAGPDQTDIFLQRFKIVKDQIADMPCPLIIARSLLDPNLRSLPSGLILGDSMHAYSRTRVLHTMSRSLEVKSAPAAHALSWTEHDDNSDTSLKHIHHFLPNIWNHELIQSLNSPFSAPSYLVSFENAAKEIKVLLKETFVKCSGKSDLSTRLSIVNSLLCLGIDRHFKQEITDALDYVYRCWNKNEGCIGLGTKSATPDLNATALAFRLLRLHRYANISPEVFRKFQCIDGSFLDRDINYSGEGHVQRIKTALNLLTAAYIQFPREDVLREAEACSVDFLTSWLSHESKSCKEYPRYLVDEVRYALKYPWYMNCPRWEARASIDFYAADNGWLRDDCNRKLIEFAKLDFNFVQAGHQQELKQLSSWWNDSQVSKLTFYRHRPVESYLIPALGLYDPGLSDLRLSLAKTSQLGYIMDDMYDTYADEEEISVITEAVARFHNLNDQIQYPVRAAFSLFLQTACMLNRQCVQKHGRCVEKYLRQMWLQLVKSYVSELAWNKAAHLPKVEQYLKNGAMSVAIWPLYFTGKLLICDSLPSQVLEKPIPRMSEFDELCGKSCRLNDDLHDFEESKQELSAVKCWLKQHSGCSKEDALVHLREMLRENVRQVAQAYLGEEEKEENAMSAKRLVFELTRSFHFFYAHGDGFTHANHNLKDQIRLLLFDPVI